MYGLYNQNKDYVLVLINRAFSHTLRKVYIEIHRNEFTDEEYLISQYSPFHPEISHKFTPFQPELHIQKPKICVSRNPYNRALSSFYLFCKRRTLSVYYIQNNRIPDITAASLLFDKSYDVLNFENFLEFMNKINPYEAHFNHQSFNFDKFNNNITYCKFGEMNTKFANFYTNMGYTTEYIQNIIQNYSSIQYHTSGEKKYYTERRQYTLLSDKELFNMEFLPDLKNMLTPKTEELIYNHYKNDFEKFGYLRYSIAE